MQARTKNRITLIGIFLLFLIPVLIAIVLNVFNFKTQELKNKGQLIEPPVLITEIGSAQWLQDLQGTWTLIHRNMGSCDASCGSHMRDMHQIRLAMGRRAEKLNLLVLTDEASTTMNKPTDVKIVSVGDEPEIQKQFATIGQTADEDVSAYYIVAPEGYLMLRYGSKNTPPDIIKDLQRLLKRKGDAS